MRRYLGAIRHVTHYEKLPTAPMAIEGWIRLIKQLGGEHTVDSTEDGLIDITVPKYDPRDGSLIGSQPWTLIPEDEEEHP